MTFWDTLCDLFIAAPEQRDGLLYPDDAFDIPVLLVSCFPLDACGWVDIRQTGDIGGALDDIRQHTLSTTEELIQALEVGSMYHGYKDPAARPSLRYRVVDRIEFHEPLPTYWKPLRHAIYQNTPMTDYNAIMRRIDARRWVEERGVKEIWLWGYHGGVVNLWESNMASRYGDISNSDRDPHDLPVFSKTYTVYHYNYQRHTSEACEDHMHQIEAVLRHADAPLFWDQFVGKPGEGRCGWTHYPPNGERDYDWRNPTYVWTDIEDWQPDGGKKTLLNCERWRCDSLLWFVYWMQNLPGRGNGIVYRGRKLTNWWAFIGDWDGVMSRGMGLVE